MLKSFVLVLIVSIFLIGKESKAGCSEEAAAYEGDVFACEVALVCPQNPSPGNQGSTCKIEQGENANGVPSYRKVFTNCYSHNVANEYWRGYLPSCFPRCRL